MIPQPPITEKFESFLWQEWFRQVRDSLTGISGTIPWSSIDTSGSNITDITTRNHNQLQSMQGGTSGEYYHLTQAQYNNLVASPSIATKTSNYTITTSDRYILADSTSGTITMTLPVSSGIRFTIKKTAAANTVIVSPSSGLIDGVSSVTLTARYMSIDVVGDGSNYWIV